MCVCVCVHSGDISQNKTERDEVTKRGGSHGDLVDGPGVGSFEGPGRLPGRKGRDGTGQAETRPRADLNCRFRLKENYTVPLSLWRRC